MVCEQICSCHHKVDQSLWQTLSTFDLIHSSHMSLQTIWSCGKFGTTMQIRIVSGLWFCRRPRRLKVIIRWALVHTRKSHVRANKLDVQETDFSFTQFYRIRNRFFWCKIEVGWYSRSWSMGSDCFCPWKHNSDYRETGETRCQFWKCLYLARNGRPRYSTVSEQICTIDY